MKILKSILSLLLPISLFFLFFAGDGKSCPPQGDKGLGKKIPSASELRYQTLDTLKNRNHTSNKITNLSIDEVMIPGDDTKRFKSDEYVDISGYVYDVKWGGSETCNCHSKDKDQLDIHIDLVKDLKYSTGDKTMIVEINRYTRSSDKSMTYNNIRSLRGKKVEIKGWLFFDEEHKHNAKNTNPNGTNVWRATCWEVHPCMYIQEIK